MVLRSLSRIYDEVTFRHLLAIERERSRRSGRPFLLLLIEADGAAGARVVWDPTLSRRIFSGLSRALRETDFIGWYLTRQVAGAVLTELGDDSRAEVADVVAGRVGDELRAAVHPSMTARLRVRCSFNPEHFPGGLACSS